VKKSNLSGLLLLLVAGLVPMAQALASSNGHKVEVHDAAAARAVEAQGGRLIADYGGFQLYDVPQISANLPGSVEVRDGYNSILLNAVHLDTSKAGVQALRKTAEAFGGKRMHLVQFAGPVQPAWRKALLEAGVQIVSYIPQNAYLVYGDSAGIGRVQALAATAPHIQWDGAYLDDYKIHPHARAVDKKGNPRQIGTDRFAIQLMADAAANADTLKLIDQLKLAPIQRQRPVLNFVDVIVRLSAADLPKIAARPDVVSIQPCSPAKKVCERQDQIVAGNLSGNAPGGPGYLAWLESKGFTQAQFTASGFVVDVSDSGIDNGTTAPNHFGLYPGGNISSASLVAYNYLVGTPNAGSTLAGCDGHGNINAHIVMGYDDASDSPFLDNEGYHYGLGVCPFVSVGSSVIFDPDNSTNPDDTTVISTAYSNGARISNNSWGDSNSGDDGTYSVDSFEYDALVRDAQPSGAPYPAPGNQEMVIVFAAGNDGPAAVSISPPGTAKNVITVGGAENVQAIGGCDSSDVCDTDSDNANAIISFSGRGPCGDGRLKPDLVAPGTHVSGGVPQAVLTGPVGDGEALACFLNDGTGVSGGPGNSLFFPSGQQFYTASSGTSHSTPCVTGGCALVRQYFINNSLLGANAPSPAMTKAFLMNSARYMTGPGADDTLWSDSQGMGEMDLGMAFDGTPRILRDEAPADMFTASGQTRVFTGTVGETNLPFRVTIAWTDAPGSTSGNSWNNDLDLTVDVGGVSYKGNVFNGSNSIAGGVADTENNVESVFLPPGVSGGFTVTVTAANINSIGVPNASNELSQDFALVIYNAGAAATLAAAGYTLTTNEPCSDGVVNPGETVKVDLALQNIGNSPTTTNLVATLLTSNGVVFPSSPQTIGALSPGARATNTFSFFADGTCGETITAVLQLQDGPADLGIVSYNFQLGLPVSATYYAQNFDGVSAGTLPANWTASATGGLTSWTTENSTNDGTSNVAYCPDAATPGEVYLVSPTIAVTNEGASQLSFLNDYNLEETYDGGVLEIAIGASAFTDILAAGGSFVTGGYNGGLSDLGDRPHQDNPLIGRQAWTGSSGGFVTTIVNLPAAASGTNIQLRWICGTDEGNENLDGVGGWWIDDIAISQTGFECTNCPVTNVSVPTIVSPTNGYQFTTLSPVVFVTGLAPDDNSTVTISNNGIANMTAMTDGNGVYAALAALSFGSNTLTVTQGAANSSSNAVIYITLGPPILDVPPLANTNVAISGTGAAGATVYLYEGDSTNGTPLASFTITNASGNFSTSVTLPLGNFTLTATESIDGQISTNTAPVSISVLPLPPPKIVSPVTGLVTNKASLSIRGTGVSEASVTIYDVTSSGTNTLATKTINREGKFSAVVDLADGINALLATQELNGNSPPSAPVVVTDYLAPKILVPPVNQTNFLKGSVTFSAEVIGAAPMKIYWETNGVKIRGANTSQYTLSNLKPSATNLTNFNYSLTASNKYGVAKSSLVTLTLVTNPFTTNLTGAYYGLFMVTNPPAQFESSGLLTLNLTSLGRFTARILNAGGSYSFSGGLSGVGWWSNIVSRGSGKTPLTVVLDMDVTNGMQPILGTVSAVSAGTNWSASLEADRATYNAANPFTNHGKYTLIFGGTNTGAQSPGGDGYGTVSISTRGMVSLSGVLSDNTSVAPGAVSVSKDGRWPLYIPLYGRFGSLVGWIEFTNQGPSLVDLTNTKSAACSFAGTNVAWFRTNADGKLYTNGFTNSLIIIGSAFAPDNNAALLDLTNLQVILSGGNLADTLSNSVSPSSTGKFTAGAGGISGLTLSLNPATGVIRGGFADPAAATGVAPIKGVVFQEQTNAGGFFHSGANSGSFLLKPQ
jgi:hypothetical protein